MWGPLLTKGDVIDLERSLEEMEDGAEIGLWAVHLD